VRRQAALIALTLPLFVLVHLFDEQSLLQRSFPNQSGVLPRYIFARLIHSRRQELRRCSLTVIMLESKVYFGQFELWFGSI
jgi:hypothetical protein